MKRGTKPALPSQKELRGTSRPCRDANRVEIIGRGGIPVKPDWLTPAGESVWRDNIGYVAGGPFVGEEDSTMFSSWCYLQGAIEDMYRKGKLPPISALTESRRMADQFGLFGAQSRVLEGVKKDPGSENPFAKLKRN